MTKVSCNFITFCSTGAHFCDFSTFKMAYFLPVKKKTRPKSLGTNLVLRVSPKGLGTCAMLDIIDKFIELSLSILRFWNGSGQLGQ